MRDPVTVGDSGAVRVRLREAVGAQEALERVAPESVALCVAVTDGPGEAVRLRDRVVVRVAEVVASCEAVDREAERRETLRLGVGPDGDRVPVAEWVVVARPVAVWEGVPDGVGDTVTVGLQLRSSDAVWVTDRVSLGDAESPGLRE